MSGAAEKGHRSAPNRVLQRERPGALFSSLSVTTGLAPGQADPEDRQLEDGRAIGGAQQGATQIDIVK